MVASPPGMASNLNKKTMGEMSSGASLSTLLGVIWSTYLPVTVQVRTSHLKGVLALEIGARDWLVTLSLPRYPTYAF